MPMRALLLLLALALPGFAGPVVVVPSFAPTTPVHPTLLGSFNDPASPISVSMAQHAPMVSRLGHADSAAYLEQLRAAGPVERVTAEILTKAVSAAPRRELSALLSAAESVAAASSMFDGSIGTESLEYRESKWLRDDAVLYRGEKVKPLGQGGFGIVYANPAVEGQVLKRTVLSFEANVFNMQSPKQVHEQDVAVTKFLADRKLGPRLLGEAAIGRLVVSVKERIYGPTVQRLIWDRLYGPEQHALVMDLIDRMAKAGIRVGDMNPANIMLGRTLVDATIRAYHIDGGVIGAVEPHETEETLRQSLYHQTALFKQRMDHGVGFVETTVALSTMLEEGLRRSAEKTFWQRFKGHLRDALLNSNIPGK